MNFEGHLTHWRGRALKTLNREELIDALSAETSAHNKTRSEMLRLLAKKGGADFYHT